MERLTIKIQTAESEAAMDEFYDVLEARGDIQIYDVQEAKKPGQSYVFALVSEGFDWEAEIEGQGEKRGVSVLDYENGWEA